MKHLNNLLLKDNVTEFVHVFVCVTVEATIRFDRIKRNFADPNRLDKCSNKWVFNT